MNDATTSKRISISKVKSIVAHFSRTCTNICFLFFNESIARNETKKLWEISINNEENLKKQELLFVMCCEMMCTNTINAPYLQFQYLRRKKMCDYFL